MIIKYSWKTASINGCEKEQQPIILCTNIWFFFFTAVNENDNN